MFRNRGGDRFRRRRHRLLVKPLDELPDGLVGIEPDFDGVGFDEGAAEDAAGKLGDVVPFEGLERRRRNLGTRGNLPQRDAAPLASLAQSPAEVVHGSRHFT